MRFFSLDFKCADYLSGGDRRSLGRADELVAVLLRKPRQLGQLIACLWHDDPLIRMRAADVAEKISVQKPDWVQPFKSELLGLAAETRQIEVRWHLALMMPRLRMNAPERRRAMAILRDYMEDRSSIVKTCALDALARLLPDPLPFLDDMARTGTPAMKARARKLLSALISRPGTPAPYAPSTAKGRNKPPANLPLHTAQPDR